MKLNGCVGASDTLLAFLVLAAESDGRGDDAADLDEVAPLPVFVPAFAELPFRAADPPDTLSLPGAVRFLI